MPGLLNSFRDSGSSPKPPTIDRRSHQAPGANASHGHAEMSATHLNGDVCASGLVLNQVRDLLGQAFLNLEPMTDQMNDPAELRQTENLCRSGCSRSRP